MSRIPTYHFLRLLILAKVLSLQKYENRLLASAIVVKTKGDVNSFMKEYELEQREPLPWGDVYQTSIKEILATAIKATGEKQALFVVVDTDSPNVYVHIQELQAVDKVATKPVGIDPKWSGLCASVRDAGCAFLLPGDARVKVIVHGEQIAEFAAGSWRHANLKDVRDGFTGLAVGESLLEELCLSIMNKCLLASERRRGFSLVLQRTQDVRLHPGYFDVTHRPDSMGLREKPIYEIDDQTYLDKVAGDNSVIISSKGVTLAFNAALEFSGATEVVPLPGTGSRHLSAQKVTKETDAIAFVVSEDGPISIFQNGSRIQSFL